MTEKTNPAVQPGDVLDTPDGPLTFVGVENIGDTSTVRFKDESGEFKRRVLPFVESMRPDDTSPNFPDGTPWHTHYPNQLRFWHFTLVDNPDERSSRVGFVHSDTSGAGSVVATVYFNKNNSKFWALVRDTEETPSFDNAEEVLEAVVRLAVIGELGHQHPVILALCQQAEKLRDYRDDRHAAAVKAKKNPNRVEDVISAGGAYQGGLDMLAAALVAAGYNAAGYGGYPSAATAAEFLERWIDRGRPGLEHPKG